MKALLSALSSETFRDVGFFVDLALIVNPNWLNRTSPIRKRTRKAPTFIPLRKSGDMAERGRHV